jgi:hypothetical protein
MLFKKEIEPFHHSSDLPLAAVVSPSVSALQGRSPVSGLTSTEGISHGK